MDGKTIGAGRMSGMTETWQRDLLAGCLDDWGHPTEAANVRNGEDLESYESDFRLIQKLADYGLLDTARLRGEAAPEGQAVYQLRDTKISAAWFEVDATNYADFAHPASIYEYRTLYTRPQSALSSTAALEITAEQKIELVRQGWKAPNTWTAAPTPVECQACGLPPISAGLPPLKTCQCARLVMRQKPAPVAGDAVIVTDDMATAAAREWCGLTDTCFSRLTSLQQHRAMEDFRLVLKAALAQDRASQAGAAGVPEALQLFDVPALPSDWGSRSGYKSGWNDCRAAMLAAAPSPDAGDST